MINFIMKLHGFVYSRGHSIMILELTHAKITVRLLNDRRILRRRKAVWGQQKGCLCLAVILQRTFIYNSESVFISGFEFDLVYAV